MVSTFHRVEGVLRDFKGDSRSFKGSAGAMRTEGAEEDERAAIYVLLDG